MMRFLVITYGTSDLGNQYSVRENWGGVSSNKLFYLGSSLEEARRAILKVFPYFVRLAPFELDDKVIIESWGTQSDVDQCLAMQSILSVKTKIRNP